MGEKGIGRLAIASIGKQVLIITKAKQRHHHASIIGIFINWEFFELPGINLEDIRIPIIEFKTLPNETEIEALKAIALESLKKLSNKEQITSKDYNRIYASINSFTVNPKELNKKLVGNFNLTDEHQGGTFFYISPVNDTLTADIEADKESGDATKIEKMLMGFHNTMTPNHPIPAVDISFRDYKGTDDTYTNLINKDLFFTPEEFELADHHFLGTFDKYGQFKGLIQIYREKNYDHIVNWNANQFRETHCGPFEINLAYLQGNARESLVDAENFIRIREKTNKLGGLYIYKDNIRILPYGDSDYDFLDIEKNRTKRASTYFFSYRRMFGLININSENNSSLIEKAGREGFIENKAYRQLQAILKNFFLQLAADFFDAEKKSAYSHFFHQKRNELLRISEAVKKREQRATQRKNKFLINLNRFFEDYAAGKINTDLQDILKEIQRNFENIAIISDDEEASQKVLDTELEARQKILDYKKQLTLPRVSGFSIPRASRLDYDTYLNEMQLLEETLFRKSYLQIDTFIEDVIHHRNIELSKRKRLEQSINLIADEAKALNNKKSKEANELAKKISTRIGSLTNELLMELDTRIRSVKDEFKELAISSTESFDLVSKRRDMEEKIDRVSIANTETMERVIRQLHSFHTEKSRDLEQPIITDEQIADAMIEELTEVREQMHADVELSQLGLAVGILHHEFSGTIRSIRSSLKDLKAWSDVNENLESVYKNIKINFEHLDGYLNLFTPLDRRLNRRREEIRLIDIKVFLIDLFKTRLTRHNIELKHTNAYANTTIFGFRSTYYPVFVNIIDNAIYWLNHSSSISKEKIIRLHADETGIYISNNGPSISLQDKEKMFQLGFSRKPNGRGMGLNISKEVLNAENYTIYLDTPREGSSVTFKIEKIVN